MSVEVRVCQHCPYMEAMGVSHGKNCNCTHHHSDHNFAGGCLIKGCSCERYDQTDRAVRQARADKPTKATKPVQVIEAVDLEAMLEAAKNKAPDELTAATERVRKLRELKKAKEDDMTSTSIH